MRRVVLTGIAVTLAVGLAAAARDDKPSSDTGRVFEMRTYTAKPGRHEAMHKRFRDHTNRIFKKHGMEVIGYWTPTDEENGKGSKLIYLLAFPSRAAAKKAWKSFQDDPEWQRVREESHKDGVIVDKVESVFLEPTDYSPIK